MKKLTLGLVAAGVLLASGSAMAIGDQTSLTTTNNSNWFSNASVNGTPVLDPKYGTKAGATVKTDAGTAGLLLGLLCGGKNPCQINIYMFPDSSQDTSKEVLAATANVDGNITSKTFGQLTKEGVTPNPSSPFTVATTGSTPTDIQLTITGQGKSIFKK